MQLYTRAFRSLRTKYNCLPRSGTLPAKQYTSTAVKISPASKPYLVPSLFPKAEGSFIEGLQRVSSGQSRYISTLESLSLKESEILERSEPNEEYHESGRNRGKRRAKAKKSSSNKKSEVEEESLELAETNAEKQAEELVGPLGEKTKTDAAAELQENYERRHQLSNLSKVHDQPKAGARAKNAESKVEGLEAQKKIENPSELESMTTETSVVGSEEVQPTFQLDYTLDEAEWLRLYRSGYVSKLVKEYEETLRSLQKEEYDKSQKLLEGSEEVESRISFNAKEGKAEAKFEDPETSGITKRLESETAMLTSAYESAEISKTDTNNKNLLKDSKNQEGTDREIDGQAEIKFLEQSEGANEELFDSGRNQVLGSSNDKVWTEDEALSELLKRGVEIADLIEIEKKEIQALEEENAKLDSKHTSLSKDPISEFVGSVRQENDIEHVTLSPESKVDAERSIVGIRSEGNQEPNYTISVLKDPQFITSLKDSENQQAMDPEMKAFEAKALTELIKVRDRISELIEAEKKDPTFLRAKASSVKNSGNKSPRVIDIMSMIDEPRDTSSAGYGTKRRLHSEARERRADTAEETESAELSNVSKIHQELEEVHDKLNRAEEVLRAQVKQSPDSRRVEEGRTEQSKPPEEELHAHSKPAEEELHSYSKISEEEVNTFSKLAEELNTFSKLAEEELSAHSKLAEEELNLHSKATNKELNPHSKLAEEELNPHSKLSEEEQIHAPSKQTDHDPPPKAEIVAEVLNTNLKVARKELHHNLMTAEQDLKANLKAATNELLARLKLAEQNATSKSPENEVKLEDLTSDLIKDAEDSGMSTGEQKHHKSLSSEQAALIQPGISPKETTETSKETSVSTHEAGQQMHHKSPSPELASSIQSGMSPYETETFKEISGSTHEAHDVSRSQKNEYLLVDNQVLPEESYSKDKDLSFDTTNKDHKSMAAKAKEQESESRARDMVPEIKEFPDSARRASQEIAYSEDRSQFVNSESYDQVSQVIHSEAYGKAHSSDESNYVMSKTSGKTGRSEIHTRSQEKLAEVGVSDSLEGKLRDSESVSALPRKSVDRSDVQESEFYVSASDVIEAESPEFKNEAFVKYVHATKEPDSSQVEMYASSDEKALGDLSLAHTLRSDEFIEEVHENEKMAQVKESSHTVASDFAGETKMHVISDHKGVRDERVSEAAKTELQATAEEPAEAEKYAIKTDSTDVKQLVKLLMMEIENQNAKEAEDDLPEPVSFKSNFEDEKGHQEEIDSALAQSQESKLTSETQELIAMFREIQGVRRLEKHELDSETDSATMKAQEKYDEDQKADELIALMTDNIDKLQNLMSETEAEISQTSEESGSSQNSNLVAETNELVKKLIMEVQSQRADSEAREKSREYAALNESKTSESGINEDRKKVEESKMADLAAPKSGDAIEAISKNEVQEIKSQRSQESAAFRESKTVESIMTDENKKVEEPKMADLAAATSEDAIKTISKNKIQEIESLLRSQEHAAFSESKIDESTKNENRSKVEAQMADFTRKEASEATSKDLKDKMAEIENTSSVTSHKTDDQHLINTQAMAEALLKVVENSLSQTSTSTHQGMEASETTTEPKQSQIQAVSEVIPVETRASEPPSASQANQMKDDSITGSLQTKKEEGSGSKTLLQRTVEMDAINELEERVTNLEDVVLSNHRGSVVDDISFQQGSQNIYPKPSGPSYSEPIWQKPSSPPNFTPNDLTTPDGKFVLEPGRSPRPVNELMKSLSYGESFASPSLGENDSNYNILYSSSTVKKR